MVKLPFLPLARLRLLVQCLALFLTLWGSAIVGTYMADKLANALPALSCAYDQQNGAYCVLISTQHMLHHRIGEAIVRAQQLTLQMLLPLAFTLLTFLAFFIVIGKAFCGWICPLGTLQDWLNKVGRRFQRPLHRFTPRGLARLRPVKWLILLGLVFLLPLLTGLGVTPHSLGNPYCDLCPSRIASTLLSGNTEQLALNLSDGWSFALGALSNALAGFVVVAALAVRQPFCRICPMLSFNSLFQRASLLRLVKQPSEHCERCGICTQACPMDIPEIAQKHGPAAFHEDCTLCGRCAEYCPQDGVIRLQWGPWAWFSSRRAYYREKVQGELPDGTVKPIRFQARERPHD